MRVGRAPGSTRARTLFPCTTLFRSTIIVDDVNKFPGHIDCSSLSLSEIVVPFYFEGKFVGVLDVDGDKTSSFDEIDSKYLNQICQLIFDF